MAKLTKAQVDQGRAALIEAQATFIALPRTSVDRKAFNRLRGAIDELSRALLAFRPLSSANGIRMLALLQGERASQGEAIEAHQMTLHDLEEFLVVLRRAAAHEVGTGRQPDQAAQQWVWTAADAWFAVIGKTPSHSEDGEFWKALQDLQQDEVRRVDVPIVTQDVVRLALDIWREVRKPGG